MRFWRLIYSLILYLYVQTGGIFAQNYRLPTNVIPSKYVLELTVENDFVSSRIFEGRVTITLTIEDEMQEIKLHAGKIDIFHSELNRIGNIHNVSQEVISYDFDDVTEILTIRYAEVLTARGEYELILEYIGALDDINGFYQSSYSNVREVKVDWLCTTQFAPTYTRRAFPCFDEPQLKATFQLTFNHPQEFNVISNTLPENRSINQKRSNLVKTRFKETPKMSTYLLAFIMSKFTETRAEDEKYNFSVWARPGTEDNREVSLDQGPKLLQALSDWTNISYADHGLGKMYVAAIPDFNWGAMENWGMITYREPLLLDDGNDTANINEQNIATTVAHEFAHSWFGNLVTFAWWSDAWLNEGFATYFEYHITAQVNPEYELDKQFLINIQQHVLQTDALESALPLSSPKEDINTPEEIANKFAKLTYHKGGSILRMVQHFLGGSQLQDGLRVYLQNNKFSNVFPQNVWDAIDSLSPSNLPEAVEIGEVMENWVTKPGFPVLTVTLNDQNKIELSQKRFLITDNDSERKWYVPISYTKSSDDDKFTDTSPKIWLKPEDPDTIITQISLEVNEWIILNNQATGYFRVNYNEFLWQKIFIALNTSHFGGIVNLNRAQLVDDMFNLARVGYVPYKSTFQLLEYLSEETDFHAWSSAFNGFSFLMKRTGSASDLGKAIADKVLSLMSKLYDSVPISDTKPDEHIYTLNQVLAVTWACNLGKTECVSEVQKMWDTFYADWSNYKANINFLNLIYCTGIRNADDDKPWSILMHLYQQIQSSYQKSIILNALGCTPDIKQINKYLNMTIDSKSPIRKQDGLTAIQSVYSGSAAGVDAAFNFFREQHEAISSYFEGMISLSSTFTGLVDKFTTQLQIDQLQDFIEDPSLAPNLKIVGAEALEAAKANVAWLNKYEDDLKNIFNI